MKELNELRVRALIGSIIGYVLLFGGFFTAIINPIGFMLFLIGIIVTAIVGSTLTKQFKEAYKTTICKEVLEKMFTIYDYQPHQGFTKDEVRSTYLISSGNRYSSDDYIRGSYNNIEFERSDVCMQDHRSNGKTSTTVTLFKGSWSVFTFPKKISSYLVIKEKEFLSNSKPGGFFSNAPETSKVTFEDIRFNEDFVVYAENEHDAFYVCTPHFIERIKALEARFEGRMTIGIINQKVHVLFYNDKNAMEPSLFNEVTEEDYKMIENEMSAIIEIIDILKLMED